MLKIVSLFNGSMFMFMHILFMYVVMASSSRTWLYKTNTSMMGEFIILR